MTLTVFFYSFHFFCCQSVNSSDQIEYYLVFFWAKEAGELVAGLTEGRQMEESGAK